MSDRERGAALGQRGTAIDTSKAIQYEFYDYDAGNYGEIGNSSISDGALTAQAEAYWNFFLSLVDNHSELYDFSPAPVQANQAAAFMAYTNYIGSLTDCGGS